MTANDDLTKQHDPVVPIQNPQPTIDDIDEDQVDAGEDNGDLDKMHEEAFGDEDNRTIKDEINEDEIDRVKDLPE